MKVVFAGPSLYGADIDYGRLDLRPPASRGDIAAAVREGATHIGLIDGYFGWVASVWHKEILFALESGVVVCGAASMGALRAADCAAFGMVPIGRIAGWYIDGTLDDDGDVAIVHAPAELGYAPLTEALVDARATLDGLLALGIVTAAEHLALRLAAENLNFRDRTADAIVMAVPEDRRTTVRDGYVAHRISLKQQDARLMIESMQRPSVDTAPTLSWKMADSFTWRASGL